MPYIGSPPSKSWLDRSRRRSWSDLIVRWLKPVHRARLWDTLNKHIHFYSYRLGRSRHRNLCCRWEQLQSRQLMWFGQPDKPGIGSLVLRLCRGRVHDYPGPRRDRDQIPAGFLNRDRWSRRVFLAGNAPSAYARHNLIAKQNLQKKKWRPRGRPSRQTVTANQLRKKAKSRRAAAVSRTHGLWVFKLALYH